MIVRALRIAVAALAVGVVVSVGTRSRVAAQQTAVMDDLKSLSDEFTDAGTLVNWRQVYQDEQWGANQLEHFGINGVRKDCMVMMPYTSTWYKDYRGVLTYKPVEGDFVMTTRVYATRRGGEGAPRSAFSLGGILIRAPRDVTPQTWQLGGENYVFLSLGAAMNPGTYMFEVKTTVNSDSQLATTPAGGPEAIIQGARIGPHFIMLRKTPDGPWVVQQRYYRPDMPAKLQAGLTCYTDYFTASKLQPFQHNSTVIRQGNPDLVAIFDYVRYHRPVVPANLAGKRLSDPREISDADLLTFLGDNAAGP